MHKGEKQLKTKNLQHYGYILIFVFLFICLNKTIQAQSLSNLKTKTFIITADTLQIDSLSIVPQSEIIRAKQTIVDTAYYHINYALAQLIWKKRPVTDTISITYRRFPFSFAQRYVNKDRQNIRAFDGDGATYQPYKIEPQTVNDLFDLGDGLNYGGSFGRSISFGNSQSVVVNSNFDLRMSGKLGNDIEILAAISDNNIPFQPEGNTQQLQEFDRIFIQLKKDQHTLLVGDYDIKRPNSYFMNFSRRLQGLQLSTNFNLGKGKFSTSASGAIAKGNFNRMTFVGQEGNQGPYKLIGANGELFIIALAGSEKVYIDGKLLTRGLDQDYIVDYNTAEITFTDQQVITKDKRIVIEFEYADQNYLRSLFYVNANYQTEKLRLYTNMFSEQDAKNQRLTDGDFSPFELDLLQTIGDDLQAAVLTNFDTTAFNPDAVQYKKIDTMVQAVPYSIFVYSTNADSASFQPSFRFVGEGNGDYVISTQAINGRVYRWVAPDSTGLLQGNYALGNVLIPPQKRQLMTLGADYQLAKNQQINAEVSMSNRDVNTFSDINDGDDVGLAAQIQYNGQSILDSAKQINLQYKVNYEFVQNHFLPLDPYRPVEFGRNWNFNTAQSVDQHLGSASLQFNKSSQLSAQYQFNTFIAGQNDYQGFQHVVNSAYQKKGWSASLQASYLTAKDSLTNSQFLRPTFQLSKAFYSLKSWTVGIKGSQERNQIVVQRGLGNGEADSLSNASFYFNEASIFLRTPDSSKNTFAATWLRRWDYLPNGRNFDLLTTGNTITLSGGFTKNPRQQLNWNATYRDLMVLDTSRTDLRNSRTIVGEATYNALIAKGFIRSSTQYRIGSGQRQAIEYFYQPVAGNLGNYIWIDYNDNTIREPNEFELGTENDRNFADTTYIRVIAPTNEFQRTNKVQFVQTLSLSPRVLWESAEKGIKKALKRLKWQANISLSRETIADSTQWIHYFPIAVDNGITVSDSVTLATVVAESTSIRNEVSYQLSTFRVNLFSRRNVSKNLLINGIDGREQIERGGEARYNLNRLIDVNFSTRFGQQISNSAFADRNYDIHYRSFAPAISFQPNTKFRLATTYEYRLSENRLPTEGMMELEKVRSSKLSVESTYSQATKRTVNANFSFVKINAAHVNQQSAAAYNLLQGLQDGNNFSWNVRYTTRLSGGILLTLSYDGRKNGDNRVNHGGRASLQAVF